MTQEKAEHECFRCGAVGTVPIGTDYLCEDCYEDAAPGEFA